MNFSKQINVLFIRLFLLIIFIVCYKFIHFYPDWLSYQEIYNLNGSYLKDSSLDFVFTGIIDLFVFFNIDYFLFRLFVLSLIIFFYSKILNLLDRKEQILFFFLNFVFIYFQIRQGLALSFLYYYYSKNKNLILKYLALFTHFMSIIPFYFETLNKKIKFLILLTIVFIILYTNISNIIFSILIQNYNGRLDYNIGNNDTSFIKSIIIPILFLSLFNYINQKTTIHFILFSLLILVLLYHSFLNIYFFIPNVLINGLFRYSLVYLSICVLTKRIKIDWGTIFISFAILFKDIYSSQIT